jgi:hypothetical protein
MIYAVSAFEDRQLKYGMDAAITATNTSFTTITNLVHMQS